VKQLVLSAVLLDTADGVIHRHQSVIPRIQAGETATFVIEGEAHESLIKYRLEQVSAQW